MRSRPAVITLSNLSSNINHLYDDRVLPLKQIKVASDNYAVVIVDTFHKLRGEQLSDKQALATIESAKKPSIERVATIFEYGVNTNRAAASSGCGGS